MAPIGFTQTEPLGMNKSSTPRADGLSVRWVSSAEQISSDFWSLCFPPPLEGRRWYSILDRSALDSQFTFAYGVLEKCDEPIDIAPVFLTDLQMDRLPPPFIPRGLITLGKCMSRWRYLRILFIGSPCSEHGTIGLVPGYRLNDIGPALHDALRLRASEVGARVIVYKDFPETDSEGLDSLCARRGLSKMTGYPGTRLRLNGGGFDNHLLTLKSSRRYKLRKKLGRSRDEVKLRAEIVQLPDPALLDEIFGLYWQTYQKGRIKFERLTPYFFQLMAKEDMCHFVLLRNCATAKLVGFMLLLRIGSRIINKFVGLDYSIGNNAFVYFRLYEHAIDWASRIGASEFSSGRISYSAKLELGHILIPLNNYFEHLNPLLHRLLARVVRRISWARLDQDLKAYVTAHPRVPDRGYRSGE
jgi:Acetyltransferase (GNAT) domain